MRQRQVVVFSPGHARQLAEQGFPTKAAARRFLFEHGRIPADRFPPREVVPTHPLAERAIVDGQVCAVRQSADLLVVVAGGPGPYRITYCPSFGDTRAVTKKVEAGPVGAPGRHP